MLSYFRIQNYKSILDIKIDFSYAEGKAPNNYKELNKIPFLEVSSKDKRNRFIPCMSIYGANASGKTNIIKALFTYKHIVKSTNIQDLYFPLYSPNKLNSKYNTTIFELEIFSGSAKFKHFIEYNNEEIKKEALLKDDKIIYSIDKDNKIYNFNAITNEQYNDEKIKNILLVECSEKIENVYLQKRVFMSVIAQKYPGLNEDISMAFRKYNNNIMPFIDNNITRPTLKTVNDLNNLDKVKDILSETSNIIRKFDIDILKIVPNVKYIEVKDEKQRNHYKSIHEMMNGNSSFDPDKGTVRDDFINSYHKDIDGREIIFDMERDESKGTNVLFGLIITILIAFDSGSTILIDELDNSIHPLILAKVIEMFKSKEYNKTNAQLIFTIQCADILDMDILRVSEVAVVNKNLKSGSTFKRISDFKGIRNTMDFRKMYLKGEFSGIPFPYI